MTPEQIDHVFGRGRLKMVTGQHVEVFREAMAPGERRRYTKRFLATSDGDFGQWTEREWRILARLIGHGIRCVPDVVQFDGGAMGGARLVQTYDAGVTVDQWATMLPVARSGAVHRHVFEDCAHWWALAHHCIAALDEIHALGLVHLDIKADNICVPYGPADFDPDTPATRLYPMFTRLALIDFAFSLVSRESLATPLPIGWQKDYDYQSPRLLRALEAGRRGDLELTRELDWRCDLYSLAAMLKRYLPGDDRVHAGDPNIGWTPQRYDDARTLIFRLRDTHDRDLPEWRPHRQFMDFTVARLEESELVASLERGWTLARNAERAGTATPLTPITPMTRIARSIRVVAPPSGVSPIALPTAVTIVEGSARAKAPARIEWGDAPATAEAAPVPAPRRNPQAARVLITAVAALAAVIVPSLINDGEGLGLIKSIRSMFGEASPELVAAHRAPAIAPAPMPSPQVESKPTAPTPDPIVTEPSPAIAAPSPATVAAAPVAAEPEGEPMSLQPPAEAPPVFARDEPDELDTASSEIKSGKGGASVAKGRGKTGATAERSRETNRAAEAKRELETRRSLAASATGSKSSAAPASAYAEGSRRSNARLSSSTRTPPHGGPPSTQLAMATPLEPYPPPSAPAASIPSASGAPGVEPRDAQPSASPSAPAIVEPAPAAPVDTSVASPSEATQPQRSQSTPKQPRSTPRAQPRDDWRTQLSTFFGLVRDSAVPPAPIDERGVASNGARSGTSGTSSATPRAPARSTPAAPARAPTPAIVEPVAPTLLASAPTPAAPPVTFAAARTMAEPMPAAIPSTPTTSAPSMRPPDDAPEVQIAHARRMLAETVPRVAAQAQPEVSRVMWAASLAGHPSQTQSVVDAAYRTWPSEGASIPVSSSSPSYARRLHDDARLAGTSGRNNTEAINIELRAFAANPRDPDIAGYLANLYLRSRPAQPEIARQLALHAIAVSGSRRSTRADDWGTLAVASAMTGRETDAVRAYLVELALTNNVDRTCQTALNAYSNFGDRLRVPVSAMLSRARSQARGTEYPSCAWPSSWTTTVARSPGVY